LFIIYYFESVVNLFLKLFYASANFFLATEIVI
jgi:hypothetical protein